MSQGWTCLRCLKLLLYKKAEKEQKYLGARLVQALLGQTCLRAGLVLGRDLSWGRTCLRAGLVSGLDLSRGQTCLKAGIVLGSDFSQGRTCLGANLLKKTSGPEVSKSSGAGSVSWPNLFCGQKCLGATVMHVLLSYFACN